MKISTTLAFAALAATIIGLCGVVAVAGSPYYVAARQAAYQDCAASWYGTYSHVGWGGPVTLVVPPTAKYQTDWGWGVGNTRISPIYPQFSRGGYGATAYGPATYQTTPLWPSDTTQFGVYYARGPW